MLIFEKCLMDINGKVEDDRNPKLTQTKSQCMTGSQSLRIKVMPTVNLSTPTEKIARLTPIFVHGHELL